MIWAEMTRDQRRETVSSLWQTGATAQSIADALATSKNAVIGLIHRLPRHDRPIPRTRAPSRPKRHDPIGRLGDESINNWKRSKGFSLVPIDATPIGKYDAAFLPLPGTSPVTLVDLENGQCRWPVDIDGKTLFCGCGVVESKRYCAIHNETGRAKPEEA